MSSPATPARWMGLTWTLPRMPGFSPGPRSQKQPSSARPVAITHERPRERAPTCVDQPWMHAKVEQKWTHWAIIRGK